MENLIYWRGVAVGIDCGGYVSWFPSAPAQAVRELSQGHSQTENHI